MKHYWAKLLEIIFPKTDDECIIAPYTKETFVQAYHLATKDNSTALATFGDKRIRAAVHLNKFHGHPHATRLLAALLKTYLDALPQEPYMLIPIPLSAKRERERGYNQATLVAEEACKSFQHIFVSQHILKKQKHTPPQTTLTKEKRLQNLRGAFFVPTTKKTLITDANIIIFDDVTTTGSTLREARATVLLYKPKSVVCIALAH
jgi:ComF family protein